MEYGYVRVSTNITEKEIHCNSFAATGGLGASSVSLSRFLGGTVRKVFQSPDMTACGGVFQGTKKGGLTLSLSIADFSEI